MKRVLLLTSAVLSSYFVVQLIFTLLNVSGPGSALALGHLHHLLMTGHRWWPFT